MTDIHDILQKIEATRALIAGEMAARRKPAVAWSGGKDSQVLLFFAREIRPSIPVIYLPGLPHPTKHLFVERIAKEWRLNLHAPAPRTRDAVSKNGHVEIVELYELAPDRWLYFPVEAEPGYEPDANAHCGRDLLIEGETYNAPMDYDAVFIGHRNDDEDPTHGAVPLVDYVVDAGDFAYVYPLRDWTETGVWAASELLGIPQNVRRYNGDMRFNNDFHELCTKCFLNGSARESVLCPKTGEETRTLFDEAALERKREDFRGAFAGVA